MFSDYEVQFLTMLGHEFKTPLAIICGTAQSILRINEPDMVDCEGICTHISSILENARKLTRLSNSLMTLAYHDHSNNKLQWTNVDLEEFLGRIVQGLQQGMDTVMDIDVVSNDESAIVTGSEIELEHVFLNLLINAIQYNIRRPKITITISNTEDSVKVAIKDNGIGMSPDVLEKVFEPFKRGERSSELNKVGSGLGLFLVKNLIEQHNGDITVKSVPKCGSTFTIKLPKMQENTKLTFNEVSFDERSFNEVLKLYLPT